MITIEDDLAHVEDLRRWHKMARDPRSQHWLDVDACMAVIDDAQRSLEAGIEEAQLDRQDEINDLEKRAEEAERECGSLQARLDEAEAALDNLRMIVREARAKDTPVERKRLLVRQLLDRLS